MADFIQTPIKCVKFKIPKELIMRIISLTFIFMLSLHAAVMPKNIEAKYDVTFGLFGKVGTSKATLNVEGYEYTITIEADSAGLAQSLSGNRRERYESRGRYLDGEYIPQEYKTFVFNNSKYDNSIYTFDHKNKTIRRYRERINDEGEVQTSEETLPYYAENDLLTLYFNMPNWMENLKAKKELVLYAVGANKEDGHVNITLPQNEHQKEVRDMLGCDTGDVIIVRVNQRIFTSEHGELFLHLDKDLLSDKALLQGVIFFGDIRGEMVEKRVR